MSQDLFTPFTPNPDLPDPYDWSADAPPPTATGFQILTEIACTINSVLDLDQLYWVIYEQCSRVFETENFWIGRCTDDLAVEAVLWFYHGKQIVPPGQTIPVERGLNTEVLRTRRPLRVAEYRTASRERGLPPESGPAPDESHAWIGVPMLVGDRLIGIIANSRPQPFTAEDSRLLEAIAALCAVAIENAGLVQLVSETAQGLMRRTKELSDLNNVASAVNRSLDLPTVLAQGADMLLRATGWDMATVSLCTASGQWEVAMHRHAGSPPGGFAHSSMPGDDSDICRPSHPLYLLVTQALESGRPVAVNVNDTADMTVLHTYRARGLRRLVIFPLLAGAGGVGHDRQVLGLLLLGSRGTSTGKVTAEMLRDTTLLAIGEQLATAVQNARLMDAEQTARSHLAAVLESTTDGVIFYDNDLRVEVANRAVHEIYGLPPGAFIGCTPEEVAALVATSTADTEQPFAIVRRLRAASPDTIYSEEVVTHRPRRRVLQRSVSPVRDDAAGILGRLVVYHDVTEAKDLERRTRELAALEERQRLARELHDSVTQSLFTVTLMAEAAQAMAERDPARVALYLDRLKSTAGSALEEMRALLAQLRPPAVGASGLGPALRRHAETVGQQLGLTIEVEVEDALGTLPSAVEDALYRITQEALHNVIKHAGAHRACVRLGRAAPLPGDRAPALVLTVEDDGQGFDPGQPAPAGSGRGLGLTGMRERAAALGGAFTVESIPGQGSRIVVAVPLPTAE